MASELTRSVLEAAHCWEESDRAGTPAMTEFRRGVRYHQAMWREAQGFPIGTLPIVPQPGRPSRPIGSRMPLSFAMETGANLLGRHARKVATARAETVERHQSFDEWSGAFAPGSIEAVNGARLLEMWLDHLLVLSMLQHEGGLWRWGRFVQVHPAGNLDYVDACARYSELLVDPSTFASATIEDLLGLGALPRAIVTRLRRRYLPD